MRSWEEKESGERATHASAGSGRASTITEHTQRTMPIVEFSRYAPWKKISSRMKPYNNPEKTTRKSKRM